MILINTHIPVNGKDYDLLVQVTSKDGLEPHGLELHLMLEGVKKAIEVYQDRIEDEI